MRDNYQEVTIVIVAGAIIFLVLTGIMFFIVLFYQKKKFEHYRQLTDLKLEIQEQTFNTISQEIHDNVGQILSLVTVQLNILDKAEVVNKEMLREVKELVRKAMSDLRNIAKNLNSEFIQQSNLIELANTELEQIHRAGFMKTELIVEGETKKLNDQKKLILFRIIQETLQNILKHSQAKNISVYFQYKDDHLQIRIIDDGIGFDKNILMNNAGIGIRNIISRAALIGGNADILSNKNEGTFITVISPYA